MHIWAGMAEATHAMALGFDVIIIINYLSRVLLAAVGKQDILVVFRFRQQSTSIKFKVCALLESKAI